MARGARAAHTIRAAVGFTAVGALVLTGCSSSKSSNSSSSAGSSASSSAAPSSSASSSSASSSPASSSSASGGALQGVVVQPGDLGSGWTSTPYQADPNEAAGQAALMACLGVSSMPKPTSEAHSPDFSQGDSAQISSDASQYASAADVQAQVAILSNPKISPCYQALIAKELATSLPAGSKVNTLSVKIAPVSSNGPGGVVGIGTSTISVTAQSKTATIYQRIAFIKGQTTTASVVYQTLGSPPVESIQDKVFTAVATRASAI